MELTMADRTHEPASWGEWRRRIDALAFASACAETGEEARHLRAFHALVVDAPAVGLLGGVAAPSARRLEALIDCGAGESAALAFVDRDTGCMVSRGADGFHMASIALPGGTAEASARGATMALAVLAALSAAIGNLAAMAPAPIRLAQAEGRTLH